jgi:glycerol-3-phosphate acyltransferase PlsY
MDAEDLDVQRRAAIALVMAQVRLGHELRYLVGFSEGEGVADHDGLVEDLDKATDVVAAEVPTKEVIREAL